MKVVLLLLPLLIAACAGRQAHDDEIAPAYTQREYTQIKPTAMDNTLTWNQAVRAGSAYRGAAYYHVLGTRTPEQLQDHPNKPAIAIGNTPGDAIERALKRSYSIYETQRWERFCGGGKMDSRDWDFVASQGRSNIPEQLAASCTPPAYTRQDYLTTWAAYCAKDELSVAQSLIKKATIAPPDSCKH
ncbi:MAG: hypothetical protein KTR20_05985 [Cellvibrionaceae bacterium]|nr:hypothetical protein [Cellvibrionaceae bacterium]